MSTYAKFVIPMALIGLLPAAPAVADTTFFNTGDPDGRMATATRPESAGGKFEIESADDFILGTQTSITGATFTGLLTDRAPLRQRRARSGSRFTASFPTTRMSGAPAGRRPFSTPQVPTRLNSPSDVELTDRDTASGNLDVHDHGHGHLQRAQHGATRRHPSRTGPNHRWRRQDHGRRSAVRRRTSAPPSISLLVTISSCLRSRLRTPTAISFGCRRRDRSPAALGLSLATCRSGPAMRCSTRTGCASARTSWAARPPDLQRGVLAVGLRGSRAFDLGHDAARLCGSGLCRLSQV